LALCNERQRVWQRENRQMLVKCHLCRDCGKQDAHTMAGHSFCYECNEKRNAWARAYREKNRERENAKRREKYAQRKTQHLCASCGREMLITDKHCKCPRCRGDEYKRYVTKYIPKRVGNVCFQCCTNPPLDGKKLCQSCYDKNLVKLQKALTVRKERENVRLNQG